MNTSATTQPKAFILTLSNELLDIIAVHLLTDLSALSKFSQTCRELEAIARPVMFKSFSEPDGSEREADKGLQVFLESIQQNSKLGAYVRNLRITDLQCSKDAEDSHHGLFSAVSSHPISKRYRNLRLITVFYLVHDTRSQIPRYLDHCSRKQRNSVETSVGASCRLQGPQILQLRMRR